MKKLFAVLMALCMLMGMTAMAESIEYPYTDPVTGKTTYLFEFEYTYMEDVVGGGISGAAAGLNMIVENADASNTFFVGSCHSTKTLLTFVINASEAGPATLRLILGNEISAMKMNPQTLIINVNGVPFEYAEFDLPAEVKSIGRTFTQFKLGDVELAAGENIITFQMGENEYCNGATGGPLFDALKLTSTAELTMTEYPENIE